MSELPKAVWEGSFTIFDVSVKCYVLDTGQRIIDADSMAALLKAMGEGASTDVGDLAAFSRWKNAT